MKFIVLLLLLIQPVFAVEVPLVLNVDAVQVTVDTHQSSTEPIVELEEIPTVPVTGAVAYEESESHKPWALWLLLGVAVVVTVILVLRR